MSQLYCAISRFFSGFENDALCVAPQGNLESATFLSTFLRRFLHDAHDFSKILLRGLEVWWKLRRQFSIQQKQWINQQSSSAVFEWSMFLIASRSL